MRQVIYLCAAAIFLFSTPAFAGEEVVCESRDKSRQECAMDTAGVVNMVRQLSHADCIEGRTWGLNKHSVWVEGGCRAVFSKEDHHSHDADWHANGGDDNHRHSASGGMAAARPKGVPTLNATCPGGIELHVDEGGTSYINGNEATFKRINDDYFDVSRNGVTVSVSRNPDQTWSFSYTGPGRANGLCQQD